MADNDEQLLDKLCRLILEQSGGIDRLRVELPRLLRQAIDEVIDTPRTGRLTLDAIEKTEKTYIGTKVEILLRNFLGFPKGLLDLDIDGHDVDIKNTVTGNWMIPQEAIGKPCILVSANESKSRCSFGVIMAVPANLTNGENRDRKLQISSAGKGRARWLLRDEPYPANFWQGLDQNDVSAILLPRGGTDRLAMLFRLLQRRRIPRGVVEAVARQRDYMKRLRKNGGARDRLMAEGIALLSGTYDTALIEALGLPPCDGDEFISVTPSNAAERKLLREAGHID